MTTPIPKTMVLMEQEQAIKASKYRYGINTDEATKNKLVEFI